MDSDEHLSHDDITLWWAGHVERMGNPYRLLVGTPHEKRPLGRPKLRCVDNIKMDHGEKGWDGVDWIGLS
jgi:hypothetical protein